MFIPALNTADLSLKKELSFFGSVLVENATLDAVKSLIEETGSTLYWAHANSVDEAVNLWDAGVYKAVFPLNVLLDSHSDLAGIPEERIAVVVDIASIPKLSSVSVKPSVVIVQVDTVAEALKSEQLHALATATRKDLLSQGGERRVVVQSQGAVLTTDMLQQLDAVKLDVVVPSTQLTTEWEPKDGKLNLAQAFLATATTDRPDGLYATMVVDERNSALGLVFSSAQSVSESLRTGQGVYQSRKHGLWYKGATSGATQTLLAVDYDCDGDALRFIVKQHGAGMFYWITRSSGSYELIIHE